MLASIIYNYGKFCDDFKSTLKLGAYVSSAEWYSKKLLRDRNARNGYKAMEKETYHRGEWYISRIIDEEMKSDDLFLR